MYELVKLSEHDYYVDCPAKIGLVDLGSGNFAAIDSGSDKDAGKKVLRILEANGWKLSTIYATHSHADHIGGCRLLQDRTGCRVYAAGMEAAFTNFPLLEPMNLYGGYPMKELHHKFLLAQECRAETLTAEALPTGWELIELPGHSFDMVGFKTPDGNIFLADCVSSAETLEKYGIGYLWSVGEARETLVKIKALTAKQFIPAHAPVVSDIVPLAEKNREAIEEAAKRIMNFCLEPIAFDDLLKKVFDSYGLSMSIQQYVLIGSTVRSYLAWLCDEGKAEFLIEDNKMLWHTKTENEVSGNV